MIVQKKELVEKVLKSEIPFKDEIAYLLSTLKNYDIEFRKINEGDLFREKFLMLSYLIEFPPDDIIFQENFCKNNPEFLDEGYFSYFEVNSGLNAICPGLDKNLNLVFCVIHPYKARKKDTRENITHQMNDSGGVSLKAIFKYFQERREYRPKNN